MLRSQEENERLTQLVGKLFGAWARKPSVDEMLAYATGFRDLTMQQIEVAVDNAISAGGDWPPCAADVKAMAPSVAAINSDTELGHCSACSDTRYRIVQHGQVRKATLCDCVQGESRSKFEQFVGRK